VELTDFGMYAGTCLAVSIMGRCRIVPTSWRQQVFQECWYLCT